MRVAAIYDIHANLPAFEAVLQDIRQAEVEPGAYWLLLGPGVLFRHTPYDLAKAADRIRGTKYPQADAFAARNILQPPSEREMLEAFSRAELKSSS